MATPRYVEYWDPDEKYDQNFKGDYIEQLRCLVSEIPARGDTRVIRGSLYYRHNVAICLYPKLNIYADQVYSLRVQWRKYEP